MLILTDDSRFRRICCFGLWGVVIVELFQVFCAFF